MPQVRRALKSANRTRRVVTNRVVFRSSLHHGPDLNLAATLYPLTGSGLLTYTPNMALDATLEPLTGASRFGIRGSATLQALTSSSTMSSDLGVILRLDATLPALTTSGSIVSGAILSLDATMEPLSAAARFGMRCTATLEPMTASGTMSGPRLMHLSATLQPLSASGSVFGGGVITIEQTLPALVSTYMRLDATLQPLTAQGAIDAIEAATANAVVMNATNGAVTQYTNYGFLHILRINNQYYGLKADGYYLLEGADDAGTLINCVVKTARTDFRTAYHKRVPYAYLNSETPMSVRPYVDGESKHIHYSAFNGRKTTLSKGNKGKDWEFELRNVDGGDFQLHGIELIEEVLSRRV